MGRLPAAEIVERNVLHALQPSFRVPRCLAVADVIDDGRGHRTISYSLLSELESEISGAAGRFMPTQAIERLLATPRIIPRLPCIRPAFCDTLLSNHASLPGLEVHQHSGAVEPKSASALTLFSMRLTAGIDGRIGCYDG